MTASPKPREGRRNTARGEHRHRPGRIEYPVILQGNRLSLEPRHALVAGKESFAHRSHRLAPALVGPGCQPGPGLRANIRHCAVARSSSAAHSGLVPLCTPSPGFADSPRAYIPAPLPGLWAWRDRRCVESTGGQSRRDGRTQPRVSIATDLVGLNTL